MSLIFCDSFEQYATEADMIDKYTTSGSSATLLATSGRFGDQCMQNTIDNNQDISDLTPSGAAASEVFHVGFAYSGYEVNTNGDSVCLMYGNSGSNLHVLLNVQYEGSILIQTVGVTRGYTRAGVVNTGIAVGNVYDWIECRVFIHDTVGTVELRVNGVVEFTWTGDTNAGGNGTIDRIYWLGTNVTYRYDTRLCWDDRGATDGNEMDDFIGECRVFALQPVGPPTADEDWENAIDTDENWTQVDGATVDDDTTYVQEDVDSSGGGRRDRYEFEDLPAGVLGDPLSPDAIIHGVNLCTYAKKDDSLSEAFINQIVESNGSEEISDARSLSTAYKFKLQPVDVNPEDGSMWTQAKINAITAGQEIS